MRREHRGEAEEQQRQRAAGERERGDRRVVDIVRVACACSTTYTAQITAASTERRLPSIDDEPSIAVRDVSAISATPASESAMPIAQREEIASEPGESAQQRDEGRARREQERRDADVRVHDAADEHHLIDAVAEHAEGEKEQHLARASGVRARSRARTRAARRPRARCARR